MEKEEGADSGSNTKNGGGKPIAQLGSGENFSGRKPRISLTRKQSNTAYRR